MKINSDCKFFKGDIPCLPHKENGYHCDNCPDYSPIKNKILIIKLGAIGDVIRSTPILRKIKSEFPHSFIYWLTYYPDILSKKWVDNILNVKVENIEFLKNLTFDWLINLDKEPLAISLTNSINAKKKNGFIIDEFGHAKPISNKAEEHKWLTGLFDDISKKNKKNYMQEIFEICGYEFDEEEYILEDEKNTLEWNIDKTKKVIGLNTGCGKRWPSRLWPINYWIELTNKLIEKGYEVILLGGADEHERNLKIEEATNAKYFGHFDLKTFINLVNQCDLIVTAVSMAMHLAIGLKKKIVLFNNIFNKHEFHLYNRGEILEPEIECDCYYSPVCEKDCMQYLYPEKVFGTIEKLLR